jgi:hypothetical protein
LERFAFLDLASEHTRSRLDDGEAGYEATSITSGGTVKYVFFGVRFNYRCEIQLYDARNDLTAELRESGVWRGCAIRGSQDSNGSIHPWQTCSAISGDRHIPCFLLLDDLANELFLSVGLGADRILTPAHAKTTLPFPTLRNIV